MKGMSHLQLDFSITILLITHLVLWHLTMLELTMALTSVMILMTKTLIHLRDSPRGWAADFQAWNWMQNSKLRANQSNLIPVSVAFHRGLCAPFNSWRKSKAGNSTRHYGDGWRDVGELAQMCECMKVVRVVCQRSCDSDFVSQLYRSNLSSVKRNKARRRSVCWNQTTKRSVCWNQTLCGGIITLDCYFSATRQYQAIISRTLWSHLDAWDY